MSETASERRSIGPFQHLLTGVRLFESRFFAPPPHDVAQVANRDVDGREEVDLHLRLQVVLYLHPRSKRNNNAHATPTGESPESSRECAIPLVNFVRFVGTVIVDAGNHDSTHRAQGA